MSGGGQPMLVVEQEWDRGLLRFRLCTCPCRECVNGEPKLTPRRLLAAELENLDLWACVAYVPQDGSWDALVALDAEGESEQQAITHSILLAGARWPMDSYTADAIAETLQTVPDWMLQDVGIEELRRIRRWVVPLGVPWQAVPAALAELRHEVTLFDRPVKPQVLRP